jgi:hypothetical protein
MENTIQFMGNTYNFRAVNPNGDGEEKTHS